ncbi:MAG: deoxyribose-phosphate aldolase [Lachnospiraceae bacterium]|nr:deoxyribose-phosphate aldolase [Lachnospiraceae bacterium]
MEISEILKTVDHTNLSETATWEDIKTLCDDAIRYQTATVCITPIFVKKAKEYVKDKMKVCTVVGFPYGYHTTNAKSAETIGALADGADEIDMVINMSMVKEGRFDSVTEEIKTLKEICKDTVLKVIIETCLLTEEEKIKLCKCVTDSGADFIKTSTGFAGEGAIFADVELLRKQVGAHVQVKAAGGIKTLEDAEKFIELGATRLGTSRIIKIVKQNMQ